MADSPGVPPHLAGAEDRFQIACWNELATPLQSDQLNELRWYFKRRRELGDGAADFQEDRYQRAQEVLAIGGRELFFAEASGPRDEKLTPQLRQTAVALWRRKPRLPPDLQIGEAVVLDAFGRLGLVKNSRLVFTPALKTPPGNDSH